MPKVQIKSQYNVAQFLGAVLWPSFLWAGLASMLFFATFDPVQLGPIATYRMNLTSTMGYTLGFFGFWMLGSACSVSTLFLLGHLTIERRS